MALGTLIAGCGSSGSSPNAGTSGAPAAPPTASAAQARNPVDILKMIPGCQLAPGVTVGDHDAQGDRYATCSFNDNGGPGGTNVVVYTAAGAQPNTPQLVTDDSHKVIKGSDFVLVVTGDWASYSAHIDPQAIAAKVGGKPS